MRRRTLLALISLAVIGALVAAPRGGAIHAQAAPKAASYHGQASVKAAGADITFGAPTIVDPVHTYGEPDVHIARNGICYASGPWGTGTQRSIWNMSLDGCRTFKVMHDTPITSADQSDSQIAGPGGGDTEISIARSGKVFYADLAALADLKVATWDPSSKTMQVGEIHNGNDPEHGYDRQWFANWDPPNPAAVRSATGYTGPFPVNYLVVDEALVGNGEEAGYSTDGINYTDQTTVYPLSDDGPLAIDQQTGTVFQAIGVGNDPRNVGVAILRRGQGATSGDPALTTNHIVKIARLDTGEDVGDLFPVIAMDSARNLYVAWSTEASGKTPAHDPSAWQLYYSYASAASGWLDWSNPRKISMPISGNPGEFVMPWAVAGSNGRLAVVSYATSDSTHDPSSGDVHQAWNVMLDLVTNANSSSPTVSQMTVSPHPMHYGTICFLGTGCVTAKGNRNLADFFEDGIDPRTGALLIVYDDTSNELVQDVASDGSVPPPVDGSADHRGAPVVTMIRQKGGTGMFGTPIKGRPALGTSLRDRKGDAKFDPLYGKTNIPQLDLRRLVARLSGNNLVFRLRVKDLHNLTNGLTATGAQAVDYVVRWSGPAKQGANGEEVPVYYASVEVDQSGTPAFYTGAAHSAVELCSVSACFPHIMTYPRPPYGGTDVTGKLLIKRRRSVWIITVPRSVVGNPSAGTILQSLGGYAFAMDKSASEPPTNSEGQGGITPIQVDGVCCTMAKLGS